MTARPHAVAVRLDVALVVRLRLAEPVGGAGGQPDDAADARALAGALPTAGDRAAGRADAGAEGAAHRRVPDHLAGLVAALRLGLARLRVARLHRRRRRRARRHAGGP